MTFDSPKKFEDLSKGGKIATVAIGIPAGLIYGTFKLGQKVIQKGQEIYSEYQENKALAAQMKKLELRIIKDEAIREAFDEAVISTQDEINITAMKLNYVAERYESQFRALLDKNVTIKILYGRGEDNTTYTTADSLKKTFCNYPNFKMKRTDNHARGCGQYMIKYISGEVECHMN